MREPDWTNLGQVILHAIQLGPGWCVYVLSSDLKLFRIGRVEEIQPDRVPNKGAPTGRYERRVGTGIFVHEITVHIKYVVKPERKLR